MENNKKFNKNDPRVRYALWKAYDFREYYTGKMLDFNDLEVDHIIPESLSKSPAKLKEYLKLMNLDDHFELNSIFNYVPSKKFINNRKSNELLPPMVAAIALNTAREKAKKILKNIELFDKDIKVNKVITHLKTSIKSEEEIEYVYDILSEDCNEFKEEKYVNKEDIARPYNYSRKRVKLQAFLPSYRECQSSCLFIFRTLSIRGCMITLDNKQIINQLFRGINTKPEHGLRGFIPHSDSNGGYYIQLGNNRFILNAEETDELCSIIDDFVKEYLDSLIEVEKKLQTINFIKSKNDGYKLIRIDNVLWRKIVDFAKKNDAFNSSGEWSVFEPNEYMLKVYTQDHYKYGSGYHAIIHLERDFDKILNNYFVADNKIWLVWKPYFTIHKNEDISVINDKEYWSTNKVIEWLTEELIPRVIYEDSVCSNIWGKLKISYDDFIKNFDISNYADTDNIFLIEDQSYINNCKKILEIIEVLQSFFSTYETIFLKKEELKNIYLALLMIINKSKKVEISYISGNLGFEKVITEEDLIGEINEYIQNTNDTKVGSFTIDTTLRCMQVCLRDFKCILSLEEIHKVYSFIEPLITIYNRDKVLKKNI